LKIKISEMIPEEELAIILKTNKDNDNREA
jgi:hypothetical protein